jgi:hypothetical protein
MYEGTKSLNCWELKPQYNIFNSDFLGNPIVDAFSMVEEKPKKAPRTPHGPTIHSELQYVIDNLQEEINQLKTIQEFLL